MSESMAAAGDEFHRLLGKTISSVRRQSVAHITDMRQKLQRVPVVELVEEVIEEAIDLRASDIHIEPDNDRSRLRFRIDGNLYEMHEPLPLDVHAFFISRLKVMAGLDIAEHRLPQDGRFSHARGVERIDVRISILPLLTGEKAVLRILNCRERMLKVEELELSEDNAKRFKKLCEAQNGLNLICGPVNSGKTTTIYAVLQQLDSGRENIVTLEDPVEYRISGINQLQVNPKADLTFATGLRAALRQDVDVVMLGEIRDEETAEIAVRASLTGHLLFSTLHTRDTVGAVVRLMEMGIAPYLLAAAINGIIAQRLVRRLCPNCRKAYHPEPESEDAAMLGNFYSKNTVIYKSEGCELCHGTGYYGRIAIQEILLLDEELRKAIQEGYDGDVLRKMAREKGMHTLLEDGIRKVLLGLTTLDEISGGVYGEQ